MLRQDAEGFGMTEEDPIRRMHRWQNFYEEPGGLREMMGTIRATYFARMSAVEPWEVAQLSNLAIAAKVTEQLDAMIQAIARDGKIAEAADRQAEKVASIPDYKRRWATGA